MTARSLFASPTLRKRLAVVLAAVVLGGGAYALRGPHARTSAQATESAPLALAFTPGTTLRYAVAWSGTQRGRLFSDSAGVADTRPVTTIDMALDMDVYVESQSGDEATLVLSFSKVERSALSALGADVFPTPDDATAALVGRSARARVGLNGAFREVAFQRGAPDVFMNVVQWILARGAVSLGRGPAWDVTEHGPFGESRVHYVREDDARLTRTRVRYESFDAFASADPARVDVRALDGKTSLRLKDGHVEHLHEEETIRVDAKGGGTELEGRSVFDLALRGVDRGDRAASDVAYGAVTAAGAPVIGDDIRAQLLAQRTDGMTREELISDVTTMGNGGVMPSHTRWLWRATGLLRREPAIARELSKIALAPGASDKARALVLDMLASVGHAEAQAEMRKILASPVLAKSGARPLLLQRVSFLEAPERETIDTVWALLHEGKQRGSSDLVNASAHSLAAASRALGARGDASGARVMVKRLAAEIDASPTTASKAPLLEALGNASDPEVLSVAKPFASSDDAALREAAADALRRVDTRDAVELLLSLLGDPNPHVQSAALGSLMARVLTESDWGKIAALEASGQLGDTLDGPMLNLASGYVRDVHAVARIVAGIAARPTASNAIRARARALLASS